MAATYDTNIALSQSERRMVEYDIDDALNLVDLGQPQGASAKCLPIANFRRFVAGYIRTVGTGDLEEFQIVASTSAAGANLTIVRESTTVGTTGSADAINDNAWVEVDVEQIREVLAAATHVGVRVQHETAGDEAVVFFERQEPFHGPRAGLTADYTA